MPSRHQAGPRHRPANRGAGYVIGLMSPGALVGGFDGDSYAAAVSEARRFAGRRPC